jgi:hypothetical protein
MQRAIRERLPAFHWMVEFPEVFYADRPDPLDDDVANRAAYMDAFLGNPPFAGKNAISEVNGEGYIEWLMAIRPDVQGRPNTDLAAYFFRRSADLLGANGTLGLVATNTIAQGDSRLVSLKPLVDGGAIIHAAESCRRWPGTAAVFVAVVHIAFGSVVRATGQRNLDGRVVANIDSRLTDAKERSEPSTLSANDGLAFMGGKLVGAGLAVGVDEHAELVKLDRRNGEVLRPYLGGEELNRNPSGAFERYMIDFSARSLEEASRWPDLLRIIEERVRPARETDKRGTYKTYWWKPGESGGALYAALGGLKQCLVSSRVTKHLAFSLQPTHIFFSENLNVFALGGGTPFAVLQSRVHEAWARLLSSDFGSSSIGAVLRYAATDCFRTFPFPQPSPRAVLPRLEREAHRLYDVRANYMVDENVGLTITYNRLRDPACTDERILALRAMHEELDGAVIAAYAESDPDGRWVEVEVPPFCALTDDDKQNVATFEDAVIDRLFALNARRAAEEKRLGLGEASKKKTSIKKESAAAKPEPVTPKPKRKKNAQDAQLAMPVPDTNES